MSTIEKERLFRADSITLDSDAAITETAEYLSLEPVTIAREGVFPYEDGRAYKAGLDLSKAAEWSSTRLAWDHPPLKVITKPSEIKGSVDNIHSVTDGSGTRVKARLTFYKKKLTADQQELIRSKIRRDVSVGFYYEEDRTPGTWGGKTYDYVQKNFVFDHVASVDHGRCSFPSCGIGVDTATNSRIGNDPYPNEHSCRMVEPGQFRDNSFRRITQGKLNMIIGKLKGESSTSLQAFRYPKGRWTEAEARAHCQKQGGHFEAARSDQENEVRQMERSSSMGTTADAVPMYAPYSERKLNPSETHLRPADTEGETCANCIFYNWQDNTCRIVEGTVAGNLVCDEFTGKATIEQYVAAMHGASQDAELTAEQRNRIPKERWAHAPGENRSEWKLPLNDREHVVAALQALQGARGGVGIPSGERGSVKRKVCARAKDFDIQSEYCGTADANDAGALLRKLSVLDSNELVSIHNRIHKADDFTEDSTLHRAVLLTIKKKRRG